MIAEENSPIYNLHSYLANLNEKKKQQHCFDIEKRKRTQVTFLFRLKNTNQFSEKFTQFRVEHNYCTLGDSLIILLSFEQLNLYIS